ncbi:PaaI family thioesterase [Alterisphingorhabdus coralli]|uniref:PaaI family thioesterase n=1 Tax=Alterisphingorhabdus coralli TaxID=3071408 RepID=A0AA97F8M6_9SPHN|nr:PaaI family thioesterase [Parasphingorhabdus sp. SCSIO 66989]WOE76484.1 PaaI family thioesterase [Parasphingorhabdus sp. SCSIO 66989]
MAEQRILTSPSSELMGVQSTKFDRESGVATMHFDVPQVFASPRGFVQGGLIGGFLDEVMGAAVFGESEGKRLPLNLDMNMSYLKPVPIGPLVAKGKVVKMGRNVAFIEGELLDAEGNKLTRATTTAMLTEIPDGQI